MSIGMLFLTFVLLGFPGLMMIVLGVSHLGKYFKLSNMETTDIGDINQSNG